MRNLWQAGNAIIFGPTLFGLKLRDSFGPAKDISVPAKSTLDL
jgi:hypothetical protein